MTLAGVLCIIHGHHKPGTVFLVPGRSDKRVAGSISFPGRHTFQGSPSAMANQGLPHHPQQPLVELAETLVYLLGGSPAQMR